VLAAEAGLSGQDLIMDEEFTEVGRRREWHLRVGLALVCLGVAVVAAGLATFFLPHEGADIGGPIVVVAGGGIAAAGGILINRWHDARPL
jgi:hypothetical protein